MNSPSKPHPSRFTPSHNSQALSKLHDELAEFNDYCSFLCDAMPCLFSEEAEVDQHTILGARRHCHALKMKAEHLKERVQKLQQVALAQEESQ